MPEKALYKITVTNWAKHNAHAKKGYKMTLLSNNFCSDAKIRMLSMTQRWVFLNLIVTCSDHARDTVELSSDMLRTMLECNSDIDRTLGVFQSLQLVTWEKRALIKENRIKKNRIKEKSQAAPLTLAPDPSPAQVTLVASPTKPPTRKRGDDPGAELRRATWEAYRAQYEIRWGRDPVRNGQVNSNIKALVERVGEEAPRLLAWYVRHNKPFYVEKGHPVTLCVSDYQGLLNQMHLDRQFTRSDARNLETGQSLDQTLRQIREEGI